MQEENDSFGDALVGMINLMENGRIINKKKIEKKKEEKVQQVMSEEEEDEAIGYLNFLLKERLSGKWHPSTYQLHYYECIVAEKNQRKFWEILVVEDKTHTRYGRLEQDRSVAWQQKQVKNWGTHPNAIVIMQGKIREKIKKGYVEAKRPKTHPYN